MSMTYDNRSDEMELECDFCNREEEQYSGEFHEALDAAKADGWRVFKDDAGEWVHKCPDCMGEAQ